MLTPRYVAFAAALTFAAAPALAQLPTAQLFSIAPTGGRPGADVHVRITAGDNLDGLERLIFSHPGVQARLKPAEPLVEGLPPEPSREFIVSIAADVPAGVYDVRAVGLFGISNPRAFVVDSLSETSEPADNHSRDKAAAVALNSVVGGAVEASLFDYFRFEAPQGTRVVIEAWAQRIDSRLDATLVLYDAAGRELTRDRATNHRDPAIVFTAPASGQYVVGMGDSLFAGGPEYFYRLAIHTGPQIDFMLPLAAAPGTRAEVTIFGRNLPGGSPAPGMQVHGQALEKLTATVDFPSVDAVQSPGARTFVASQQCWLDAFEYRLPSPQGLSNPYLLGLATMPVVLEQEPNDGPAQAQRIQPPCEVDGQFYPRGDRDWWQFEAKQGAVFTIEVVSHQLGISTDPQLLVQRVAKNDKGEEQVADLAEVDDDKELGGSDFSTISGDPVYRFAAPQDGTYRLLLRDVNEWQSDPRRVYRLSIREPRPDFRLVAVPRLPTPGNGKKKNNAANNGGPWSVLLRRGGVETLDVLCLRQDDFAGAIQIAAEGLPAGVTCEPVVVGAGQNSVALVFTAADNAAAWTGMIRVIGRATIGSEAVERVARGGITQWPHAPAPNKAGNRLADARLTREIVLAVTDQETLPVLVEFGQRKNWDMSRAGKIEIPVKLVRREDFKEAVTLTAAIPAELGKAQPVSIGADASEGKLVLDVAGNAPLGPISVYLEGTTKLKYKRNPKEAEASGKARTQADQLAEQLTKTAQEAEAAKLAAVQLATAAEAKAKEAPEAERAAMQAEAATAAEKKTAAEKAAADLAAKAKRAADAKAVFAKRADEASKAAQPKDINIVVSSNAITLDVRPAPIIVTLNPAEVTLPRGGQAEMTIAVQRLYNYADTVDLEPIIPGGIKDLKITATAIAKDKPDSKLAITAGPETPPGVYTITLRAKIKFNNQPLQIERPLTITVQ